MGKVPEYEWDELIMSAERLISMIKNQDPNDPRLVRLHEVVRRASQRRITTSELRSLAEWGEEEARKIELAKG